MAVANRPHRGGLKEAMKEVQFFSSVDEMYQTVGQEWTKIYDHCELRIGTYKVEDERVGWLNSRYLLLDARRTGEAWAPPQAIGTCDVKTFRDDSIEAAKTKTMTAYNKWLEELH